MMLKMYGLINALLSALLREMMQRQKMRLQVCNSGGERKQRRLIIPAFYKEIAIFQLNVTLKCTVHWRTWKEQCKVHCT